MGKCVAWGYGQHALSRGPQVQTHTPTIVHGSLSVPESPGCGASKAIAEAKKAEGCCLANACAQQQPVFQPPQRRGSVMTETMAQKWLLPNNKVPGAKAR